MGAGKTATKNAKEMEKRVAAIGESLGLVVKRRVLAGKTMWATPRKIKVVLEHASTRGKTKRAQVGIDVICQDGTGTANVKFFGKAMDVEKYPMRGLVVYGGEGFKTEFKGVMDSWGAVPLEELEQWLRAFFNL